MKTQKFFSIGAAFMVMAALVWAKDSTSIADAIDDYASDLILFIPSKNKSIAVVAFETNSKELMKYFFDIMEEKIWEKGKNTIIIYERRKLEKLQDELNFSLTGAVSDETAQHIGRFVGVSVVIYGSTNHIGDTYRMAIRTTVVETGQIIFPKSYLLQMDDVLAGLLGIPYPAPDSRKTPLPSIPFSLKDIGDFTVGGWFAFSNVTGANNGDLRVGIEPYISFNRSFSETFGLNIQLGNYSGILTGDTAKNYTDNGFSPVKDYFYLSITPRFSNLPVGPGILALSLEFMPVFYLADNYDFFGEYYSHDIPPTFIFNPAIRYSLPLFGWLHFDLGTGSMGIAKGADYDKDTQEYKYGLWVEDLYVNIELYNLLGTGIALWLTPYFFISTNDHQSNSYFRKLRLGMGYYGLKDFSFGLRVDFPIGVEINKTTMEYQGVSLSPYVRATFGAIGITANFYVYHIGANTDYNEVTITPEIGISYSF
ncbi:MAG: penicillin-binding protein activator LpoB [Spirochaetaceae bacterium]|jgi:hypothetical protein|nr:penicillin-binding protein activator LpoB [Spirochaetaceae bacterium]